MTLKIERHWQGVNVTEAQRLRKNGLTYAEIGAKLNRTAERIRQLLNPPKLKYCFHHRMYMINTCYKCDIDALYKDFTYNQLIERIHRLRHRDRTKEKVYERKVIIAILIDKFKVTPGFVGKLFQRDLTTIKHLYKNRNTRDKVEIKSKAYEHKRPRR